MLPEAKPTAVAIEPPNAERANTFVKLCTPYLATWKWPRVQKMADVKRNLVRDVCWKWNVI